MARLLLPGLALAAALFVSACGSSNPKLIPQDRADALSNSVDRIAQKTDDHDCSGAQRALSSARAQVSELPRKVDRRLKANLNDWLTHIAGEIPKDCKKSETPTPSPSPSETPTETPSETPTETPTKTATATPTESATAAPSETPTVQPPDTGGVNPGNGNG